MKAFLPKGRVAWTSKCRTHGPEWRAWRLQNMIHSCWTECGRVRSPYRPKMTRKWQVCVAISPLVFFSVLISFTSWRFGMWHGRECRRSNFGWRNHGTLSLKGCCWCRVCRNSVGTLPLLAFVVKSTIVMMKYDWLYVYQYTRNNGPCIVLSVA